MQFTIIHSHPRFLFFSPPQTYVGGAAGINCLQLCGNALLVAGCADCTLRIWRVDSEMLVYGLSGHDASINFMASTVLPDGSTAIVSGDAVGRVCASPRCMVIHDGAGVLLEDDGSGRTAGTCAV